VQAHIGRGTSHATQALPIFLRNLSFTTETADIAILTAGEPIDPWRVRNIVLPVIGTPGKSKLPTLGVRAV
jgi:hypothetical protein